MSTVEDIEYQPTVPAAEPISLTPLGTRFVEEISDRGTLAFESEVPPEKWTVPSAHHLSRTRIPDAHRFAVGAQRQRLRRWRADIWGSGGRLRGRVTVSEPARCVVTNLP